MKSLTRTLLLSALALTLLPASAYAAPVTKTVQARYEFAWFDGNKATGTAYVKNNVTYVDAESTFGSMARLSVEWDKTKRIATFIGTDKTLSLTAGASSGMLDGKAVDVGGTPFKSGNRFYVPARFVVKALGGSAPAWNAEHTVLTASGLHSYAGASSVFAGVSYSVKNETGELFATDAKGAKRKIASLGNEIYDYVQFDFKRTPGGLVLVTIWDNFGEPHINNNVYYVLLKNGGVVRQSKAHYWQRTPSNATIYGDTILMNGGTSLRLIEDGTGAVKETFDLEKLGGEKDNYLVEGMDDDFLLFRPNRAGILYLYDRSTGEKTALYKELLSNEDQELAETNDVPFHGDFLVFLKRDGNKLLFRNETYFRKDDTVYEYELPAVR